jgi:hypothetical protein
MSLLYATFEIVCPLSCGKALERVRNLLSHEGVQHKDIDSSIVSIRTPVALLGVQPMFYSRRNWVGINPFPFVRGVEVSCQTVDGMTSRIMVRVNRERAVLLGAFWVLVCSLPAIANPEPVFVLAFLTMGCVGWLGVVSFLAGHLIRKEIGDALVR